MKKLLLLIAFSTCMLIACKKTDDNRTVVIDYYNAYDATNSKLNGSWTVAGTPTNTTDPYSSSLMFSNSSMVSFTSFSSNIVTIPYHLSIDKNIFYINVNSNGLVKKCQIVKITKDTLQLQSVIGATNPVTINEVFLRN
ncbi:MAG TPA: hypothetical protein VNW51_02090 [Mucilaginibacter sp.]|nr:hypothetical protein [Mucilaginibacter sp.]